MLVGWLNGGLLRSLVRYVGVPGCVGEWVSVRTVLGGPVDSVTSGGPRHHGTSYCFVQVGSV